MEEEQLGFELGDGPVADKADRPLFAPDAIRRDALEILQEARLAAENGSWSADHLRYRRIMFPLLVSWLPDESEREQLCFNFEQEAAKIELRLAA